MPNLSPKAIEAGAKAVRRHHAWSCFWSFDDAKQLVETGITAAIEADGMVMVPRVDLATVIDIARRNESAVEIECLAEYLKDAAPPAGQEG